MRLLRTVGPCQRASDDCDWLIQKSRSRYEIILPKDRWNELRLQGITKRSFRPSQGIQEGALHVYNVAYSNWRGHGGVATLVAMIQPTCEL